MVSSGEAGLLSVRLNVWWQATLPGWSRESKSNDVTLTSL